MPVVRRLNRHHDEHGAVAILVAVCMVILCVVAGIVVDLGRARVTQMASQNAADASALAAATALYPSSGCASDADAGAPCLQSAVEAAKDYAEENLHVDPGAWGQSCSFDGSFVPAGAGTSCVQFDSLAEPTKVWVQIPIEDVQMTLGKLAGVEDVPISTRAQATLVQGSGVPCGVCVLGNTRMSGNADLAVTDAGVGLNGTPAFSGNTRVSVTNGTFTTERAPSVSGNTAFTPSPSVGVRVDDPFQDAAMPDVGGLPAKGDTSLSGNGPCVLEPGTYGDISLSGNRTCTLTEGIYAITGRLSWSGNTSVDATAGVTLYFTCGTVSRPRECGSGEAGGSLSYTGNQSLEIIAPASGETQGFAILYDRGNSASLDYSGNHGNVLVGAIYAASATMNMSGNSGTIGMDTAIVVGNLNVSGNADFTIDYTQETNPSQTTVTPSLSR